MASILPLEILGLIINEIDSADLSNVSLVSSVFRQLAQEKLFSHISLRGNPKDASEQLLQLSNMPHLACRIRSLEASIFSFVEQEEIYGYERIGKEEETPVILQDTTSNVCRLSFRLLPLMMLCQNRLESISLIGPSREYDEDDDTSECLFLSVFAELLASFDFPRFRELNLAGFDARCFWALYGKMKDNDKSAGLLRKNYGRVKHFQIEDCTDRNPFDLDNSEDDGELIQHMAPVMNLQSLSIINNDNFLITMNHVTANCGNLQQIHLREIAGRGFEKFILNCPRVYEITFGRVEMLEPEHTEAQETWAGVFHALQKHKSTGTKIVLSHLRYESAARWGIQGLGFPKFWSYHDTFCGTNDQKVLCSSLDRNQHVADQRALNELYRSMGQQETEIRCNELPDTRDIDMKGIPEVNYVEVLSESEEEFDI